MVPPLLCLLFFDVVVLLMLVCLLVMVMSLLMQDSSNPVMGQMSVILSLPLPLHVQLAITLGDPYSGISWRNLQSSFTFLYCRNDK